MAVGDVQVQKLHVDVAVQGVTVDFCGNSQVMAYRVSACHTCLTYSLPGYEMPHFAKRCRHYFMHSIACHRPSCSIVLYHLHIQPQTVCFVWTAHQIKTLWTRPQLLSLSQLTDHQCSYRYATCHPIKSRMLWPSQYR